MLPLGLIGAGLAVVLLSATLLLVYRGWFLPWLRGSLGLMAVAAGLAVVVTGWSALHWQPVSAQDPLYSLAISREGAQHWRVTQRGGSGRELRVSGDLLEVRGRLLVLEIPVPGFGHRMLYRTDGLLGRASDAAEPIDVSEHEWFAGPAWNDAWRWDRALGLPFVRSQVLFPVFLPLIDGAVFDVVLSGHQLEAVPANRPARKALESREN